MEKREEVERYREKIIEMVKGIENLEDLKMIYGMTRAAHRDIKKSRGKLILCFWSYEPFHEVPEQFFISWRKLEIF